MMELHDYFENNRGLGVLSTADEKGRVNAAIYSRPHILEDGSAAFVMRDRLTHANLETNPHAVFLFKAEGEGYQGKRLYLEKISEEKNSERIADFQRRRRPYKEELTDEAKFLVIFKITKVLPLIGAK